jgi:hypothetical protein
LWLFGIAVLFAERVLKNNYDAEGAINIDELPASDLRADEAIFDDSAGRGTRLLELHNHTSAFSEASR